MGSATECLNYIHIVVEAQPWMVHLNIIEDLYTYLSSDEGYTWISHLNVKSIHMSHTLIQWMALYDGHIWWSLQAGVWALNSLSEAYKLQFIPPSGTMSLEGSLSHSSNGLVGKLGLMDTGYGSSPLAHAFPCFPGRVDFTVTKNRIGARRQA